VPKRAIARNAFCQTGQPNDLFLCDARRAMLNNQIEFMNSRDKPFRLTAEQAAWRIGVTLEDITALMKRGLLVPKGRPTQSAVKHFHSYEIEALGKDGKWLDKVEICLAEYWAKKGVRRAELKALRLSQDPPKQEPPTVV
jgi:hypothetical protein